MNFYENHHFWVNIINLVNKWWFSQQKVNILIIHQNVQNLTADPNFVNKLWFSQQTHNTSKKGFFIKATGGWVGFLSDVFSECFRNDYLKATGGWVGFFIWRFLWILPKRLSLTFFLICLYWMTNMNAFFEGKKGLGPTGPRFAPVIWMHSGWGNRLLVRDRLHA